MHEALSAGLGFSGYVRLTRAGMIEMRTKNKYLRLLKLIFGIGLFNGLCGFVFLYFWDYGLTLPNLTGEQILTLSNEVMFRGLWSGVVTGFPVWLALEKFRRPAQPRGDVSQTQRKSDLIDNKTGQTYPQAN